MKKIHTVCITAFVAAGLLAAGTVGIAYAGRESGRSLPGVLGKGNAVSVSGVFSGSLEGQVRIGGKKVFIGRDTTFRSTEKGKVSKGYNVVRKPVYVAGVVGRDGVLRATMVVVNEGGQSSGGGAGVLPDDAPR